MKKGLLALVAVLVIGGGAFMLMNKNDETTKQATDQTSGTNSTDATDATDATATSAVEIKDMAFSPSNITVKKGTKVTWTNKDTVSHTVTSDSGSTMDSELLSKGDTYSVTFDEVGSFDYHCTPHPAMTGTVTVTE